MNKKDLRINAKKIRKSLDIKNIGEKITAKILDFEPYKLASDIMLFYPLENEIDLRKLLEDKTKNFFLPKVSGNELLACPYKQGDKLVLSKFSTQEPLTDAIEDTSKLDIVIIPALMADKTKNRLGYGGGYYDRFLARNPKPHKIVVVANELIIDKIPPDEFDERVDTIISECEIL